MLRRTVIAAFACIPLAGCDGYARSFRVSAAHTGKAFSEQRLLAVAAAVARERGYTRKPATQQQYARFTVVAVFTKVVAKQGSVTLELVRDFKDGSDRFIILDWPSFTRSQESQTLEAEIRARLAAPRASNHAMEPTPPGLIMSLFTVQPASSSLSRARRRGSSLSR